MHWRCQCGWDPALEHEMLTAGTAGGGDGLLQGGSGYTRVQVEYCSQYFINLISCFCICQEFLLLLS